jgi:hypothetical protein
VSDLKSKVMSIISATVNLLYPVAS